MRLLGDTYRVQRLPHAGKRGNIHLPETAQELYADCEVLASGPGRTDRTGRWWPQQARPGDRVLCVPCALDDSGDAAWISDRRLLGVIRSPDFAQVEPAGGLALVRPDPRQLVRQSLGGSVLVAGYALSGGKERLRERGYELLLEYARLLNSERYRAQPEPWDKLQLEERMIADMSPAEYEAFWSALTQQRGEMAQSGLQGVLLDERDYRARKPLRLADALQTGVLLGLGPEARTSARLLDRVSWSFHHRAVRITVAGELLLLLAADQLDCALPVGERVEVRRMAA